MTVEQLNIIVPAITTIAGAGIGAAISYLVSRQQFKASVISANRQTWINTLRDCIAEYQSAAEEVAMHLIIKVGKSEPIVSDGFPEKVNRLGFLLRRLKLFINPKEGDHRQLIEIAKELKESLKELKVDVPKIVDIQEKLTSVSQKILKEEWERVKRGN